MGRAGGTFVVKVGPSRVEIGLARESWGSSFRNRPRKVEIWPEQSTGK